MVQPTEQLEESPDNLFTRLVAALTQEQEALQGKLDLPTVEFHDPAAVTLEEVRAKVEALKRKNKG